MAKAKGLARPSAKSDGDSKKGLIIALVFSILFVIGLGVSTYYGFAGQKNLEDLAKKADADKKTISDDREWQKYQALLLRAYILGNLSKNDGDDLHALRERAGSLGQGATNQDEVNKAIKSLDDRLGWDQNLRKVRSSLSDLVQKLQTDLGASEKLRAETVKAYEELKANTDSKRASDQKALRNFEEQLKTLNDKYVELEKARSKEFVEVLAKNNEMQTAAEDQTKKISEMKEEWDKKEKRLMYENQEKEERYQKVVADPSLLQKQDMLSLESPRGKVVYLDGRGEYAYINLGSSDNVRPQLTFSVFSPSRASGKAQEKSRKARLEVVNIEGAHVSRARITDITDPNRDPVVTGDLIYNPAWSPTLKRHIAIAGLIDLTGDGTDNTEEFVRNLLKQYIAIDAVLDLKTMELRGRMGFNTTYLVLGDMPPYEAGNILKDTDPRTLRNREVAEKLSAIQKQAIDLGIQIIPAQRFMALIGYKVPKVVAPPDYLIRGARPVPKPAEDAEAPKKPDAEAPKKDDAKEKKNGTDAAKEKKIG